MAENKEETPRLVLEAVKDLGPKGVTAVDELQRVVERLAPKSGATFTGTNKVEATKAEPEPIDGTFQEYVFDNNGTLEYRIMDPGGNNIVLASFTP